MANNLQDSDEFERQMAQRRKQNRIALLGIGAVLLIILAFSSQVANAWIYVLGTLIVVGGLLYARSVVERHYKAAYIARERAKQDAALGQDEPKNVG